jgi:hypothetical protein
MWVQGRSTDLVQNIQRHVSVRHPSEMFVSSCEGSRDDQTYGNALSFPRLPLTFFTFRPTSPELVVLARFLHEGSH